MYLGNKTQGHKLILRCRPIGVWLYIATEIFYQKGLQTKFNIV